MSSHHDWVEEVWAEHQARRPFAPENGRPLRFAVGDRVIYTNQVGAEFRRRITGFYMPTAPDSLYARGARYLVDSASFWMPVAESRLRPDGA